jgi:hypothetical protein
MIWPKSNPISIYWDLWSLVPISKSPFYSSLLLSGGWPRSFWNWIPSITIWIQLTINVRRCRKCSSGNANRSSTASR